MKVTKTVENAAGVSSSEYVFDSLDEAIAFVERSTRRQTDRYDNDDGSIEFIYNGSGSNLVETTYVISL